MPYTLDCAESFSSKDTTADDINRAFDDDRIRGEFIILTAPSGDFMQAAGEGDGPYVLEHRVEETGEHLRVASELSKQEVRDAFLAYLRGDQSWRTRFEWGPLPTARGCLPMIALGMVAGALMTMRGS